ncbi:hypothetical protein NIES4102_03560 [Chondrocystis sp. NIES-4102]|nr:hypothetical protein NIES4102_03560 [Chondrocystis sp. NIES-4102]
MDSEAIALAQKIRIQFEVFKQQKQFSQIAKLLTYALQVIPREYNQHIFGYIPSIFREIVILDPHQIQPTDVFIGEPVIYKIYFPEQQTLYNLPFFYLFCYFKDNSQQLDIYFQSANQDYLDFSVDDYYLNQQKVYFEGCLSAFKNHNISVISVGDPGQFIPGITSSYYAGSTNFNFVKLIAEVLESLAKIAGISSHETLLFGSSAGTFGALLTSTYFQQKVNVLAVNSQIFLHNRKQLMQTLFGISDRQTLLEKYGSQICCLHRFQEELSSVPNIYILANINDHLYSRNWEFYQMYIKIYTAQGINNQSVFDSYYGIQGHGRPRVLALKNKIRIAREILTMKSS